VAAALVTALLLSVTPARAQQSRDISVVPKSLPSDFYANTWAVLIGINAYQNPRIPKLNYAVNDALSLERALLRLGFRRERMIKLLDGQATKVAIERVIGDDLRTNVKASDRVLIFFAGHGKTDRVRGGEEEGYLVPVDGDPTRLFSTAISMTSLRHTADRLLGQHILFIVDACYSGFAVFNRSMANDLLEEMLRKPAVQILTAGRSQDQAQERSGHGVFTQVLLRGLEGEAFERKDWLSLEELGVWMKNRVYAESERKQLPQFGNLSGEGQFVFRLARAATPAATPPTLAPAPPPVPVPVPAPAPVAPPPTPVAKAVPEPARPQVRSQPQLGVLVVSSKVPGVSLFLGEQRLGETQEGYTLEVSSLPVGTHRLVARKDGYRAWQRDVLIAANQRAEVLIDIEPLRPSPIVKGEGGGEMALVPAGAFQMGADQGNENHRPRRKVTLGAYLIDRHEVTNGQFRTFIDARGYDRQELWSSAGWQWRSRKDSPSLTEATSGRSGSATTRAPRYWGDSRSNDARQPVVGVSWYEADAFCRFLGKRLPSEAEWEKAARGTDGRKFPWGEGSEVGRANTTEAKAERALPVGSFPTGASPYGVLDLVGNVAEWVSDWYAKDYPKSAPAENPRGPHTGSRRVVRGGTWDDDVKDQAVMRRSSEGPEERNRKLGFRCAKNP
jgi:formylglycine-generating enzyme required for sulfatase activity